MQVRNCQIDQETDQAMAKLTDLGNRTNHEAKRLYGEYSDGRIDWDEYDRKMKALTERDRLAGEAIEKEHSAALAKLRGKIEA